MDFFTLVGLLAFFYFLLHAILLWCNDCNLELAFFDKFGKKLIKLRKKVVWITQVSTQLGKELALEVARNHGKIIISSKSKEELHKFKETCLKSNNFMNSRDIFILEFDISDVKSHKDCFEKVLKHFGRLDILIINDDKLEKRPWEEEKPNMDKLLFQSNVFGVLSLSRLVVRYFNLRQKGKIAVTSSIAGLIGVPYSGIYSGTKHALHGYFNSLKIEKFDQNIQIILMCLGSSGRSQHSVLKKVEENDNELKKYGLLKKMSPERCAHLCLTAIVNNLDEVWMAAFPVLPLVYGIIYYPNLTKLILKFLKPRDQ